MSRRRLDAELVRRGLARSRESARELVDAGKVTVRGQRATKAATQVDLADPIVIDEVESDGYVSRGAHKLLGALAAFPDVLVTGRDCMDAGASTGGFTQVLLERGAARVLAVDVGYGQLAWSLQSDPRVTVMDRTNVRFLTTDDVPFRPSLIVADLSFIPLEIVLPALAQVADSEADLLLMVKPQFEVGRERVGDGVVRDPALRIEAVTGVARSAIALGLVVHGVAASPLPGPSGNVEYFLWLRSAGPDRMGATAPGLTGADVEAAIEVAVQEGPA